MTNKRILLVHPNRDISDSLGNALDEIAVANGYNTIVTCERNFRAARARIAARERYHLIITQALLPADLRTPPDEVKRGLDLLRLVRRVSPKIPAIFVTHVAPDLKLKVEINAIGNVFPVNESDDGIKGIAETANEILTGQNAEERLTITFVQQKDGKFWYILLGEEASGGFAIDNDQIRSLRKKCRRVGKGGPAWITTLSEVGKSVTDTIFNPALKLTLLQAIEEAGGVGRTRVLFKAHQAVHEIALEALLEPKAEVAGFSTSTDDVPFWMLNAPVYRRVEVSGVARPRLPLFEDERDAINCLLIEAPTSGSVSLPDGTPLKLPPITNVQTECRGLETLLKQDPKWIRGGEVCRVSADDLAKGQSFSDYLQAKLKEREWHLVHYAGHSYYCRPKASNRAGKGYVFLPGNPIEIVNVSLFASWMKDAQLVFLTSCHSSEEHFVVEMARNQIPAIVGFRWDLDDPDAADFVLESFYPSLFAERSIEAGFYKARIDAHKKHREETVWAAPMLVMNEQKMEAVV